MKRILLTFLFLFCFVPLVNAGTSICGGRPAAGGAAASCADSSCTGFLICQNFEGTGYDNSESWSDEDSGDAVSDPDDGTAIRGSQSAYLDANTGTASLEKSITASGELYGVFKFRPATNLATSDSKIFRLLDSSWSELMNIRIKADDWGGDKRKLVIANGSNEGQGTTQLTAGTDYWVWWYWKKGTGADGLYKLAVTTSVTAPGAWEVDNSNGTATADASKVRLVMEYGMDARFDQVLVKTTSIGTVCTP